MKSLHTQTIEELRSSLCEGRCSSVDLVDQLFDVIDRDAGQVGAYLSLNREQIHQRLLKQINNGHNTDRICCWVFRFQSKI